MNSYESPTSVKVTIMLRRTILQDSYNDDYNQRPDRKDDDYF